MKSVCIAIVAVIAGLSAGCASRQITKTVSFFPESNEVSGWVRAADTRTFPADRLWEYIDGDADKYIQAGVIQTLTTDYRYQDKVDAVADVYVMKAGEGAKAIFDAESSVGSEPVSIGEAGRMSKTTVTFRKGPYFVRLIAYEEAPEIGSALTALARGIEKRLGGTSAP